MSKCDGSSIRHFYNHIDGQRYDFTKDQFNIPGYWCEATYEDSPSNVAEAETEMLSGQLDAMRTAFTETFAKEGALMATRRPAAGDAKLGI